MSKDEYIEKKHDRLYPELARCPFCGGLARYNSKLHVEPIIDENGAYIDADTFYWEYVECIECGAKIELGEDEEDETTIKKWNRRVTSVNSDSQY